MSAGQVTVIGAGIVGVCSAAWLQRAGFKVTLVDAGPVGDGTVRIELTWPDAAMAYRLVQAAQQAFLDARQAAETAAIGESIAILERYSGSLHEDINRIGDAIN